VEGGEQEGCGLPGTGLGLSGHVVTCQGDGQCLCLDGGAEFETGVADAGHDVVGQSEAVETGFAKVLISHNLLAYTD